MIVLDGSWRRDRGCSTCAHGLKPIEAEPCHRCLLLALVPHSEPFPLWEAPAPAPPPEDEP